MHYIACAAFVTNVCALIKYNHILQLIQHFYFNIINRWGSVITNNVDFDQMMNIYVEDTLLQRVCGEKKQYN